LRPPGGRVRRTVNSNSGIPCGASGQIIEDEDAIRELAHSWEALQRVTLPEAMSLRAIEETVEHYGNDLA
jgi:hypothetical protein